MRERRIIQLYDEFTNCHLDRQLFLERLAVLLELDGTGSRAPAAARIE